MFNHLAIAPPGGAAPHGDQPCNATAHKLTLNGNEVYGAYFEGNMGYRIGACCGQAMGPRWGISRAETVEPTPYRPRLCA